MEGITSSRFSVDRHRLSAARARRRQRGEGRLWRARSATDIASVHTTRGERFLGSGPVTARCTRRSLVQASYRLLELLSLSGGYGEISKLLRLQERGGGGSRRPLFSTHGVRPARARTHTNHAPFPPGRGARTTRARPTQNGLVSAHVDQSSDGAYSRRWLIVLRSVHPNARASNHAALVGEVRARSSARRRRRPLLRRRCRVARARRPRASARARACERERAGASRPSAGAASEYWRGARPLPQSLRAFSIMPSIDESSSSSVGRAPAPSSPASPPPSAPASAPPRRARRRRRSASP